MKQKLPIRTVLIQPSLRPASSLTAILVLSSYLHFCLPSGKIPEQNSMPLLDIFFYLDLFDYPKIAEVLCL